MQCEDIRKHFADYIDLPTELPHDVLDHVAACGPCKLEFAELCELWEDLARVPAPAPDSAAMRARFSEALVLASQPAPEPPIMAVRPRRQWWPRQWAFRVAAVAACVSIAAFLSVSAWRWVNAPTSVTIDGVARDNAGDVIPGVTIVAVNSATGARSSVVTDQFGVYTFPNLPPGTYSVTAELEGFQSARYAEVIADESKIHVPFPLLAGASSAPIDLDVKIAALERRADEIAGETERAARFKAEKSATPFAGAEGSADAAKAMPAPAEEWFDRGARRRDSQAEAVGDVDGAPILRDRVEVPQFPRTASPKPSSGYGGQGQTGQQGFDNLGVPLVGYNRYSTPDGVVRYSESPSLPPGAGLENMVRQYNNASRELSARAVGNAVMTVPPAAATIVPSQPTAGSRLDLFNSWQPNGEAYDRVIDNEFVSVIQEQLATFSTDVDTASYTNVRRFLTQNQLPPRNAVRIEELINYFHYNYPQSSSDHPITASVEVAAAPWNPEHRLVRIGLKAKDVRLDRQPTNLVFLVDVSGSMSSPDKLPLLKNGLKLLAAQLTENDKVTIVTYAGSTRVALSTTNGLEKNTILRAIEDLQAEGSTNGGSGIQMAYAAAVSSFVRGGVNRVILATDGDFNVGITNTDELVKLIEEKAKSGVFLSVLGFGSGNFNDSMMEKLADHGNGHYVYIDSLNEARKVLVDDIAGTLVTVAKDVKIQVVFNQAEANAYRLIGYENRALATADFNNDSKDAGDMGAGHTVTALFEVVPRGVTLKDLNGEPLRIQADASKTNVNAKASTELLTLKIRYKEPDGATSKLIELALYDRKQSFAKASADFQFAAAVAAFGMILRDSPHKGTSNWDLVRSIAQESRGQDRTGAREEFVQLVERARQMWRR
jgi:Ca-activated chloride channel family protein